MKKLIVILTISAFMMPSFGSLIPCAENPHCTIVPTDGCSVVVKNGRNGPEYVESCPPSAKGGSGTKTILIVVASGLAFAGVMYYLFKTPSSKNIDGHVQLAAF
ncbi:MAG: hypothetical protein FWG80_01885 [Alphaproteobacteria bacterium]|nr:hypothetical protein [Alphaproteobacteria bacterium]